MFQEPNFSILKIHYLLVEKQCHDVSVVLTTKEYGYEIQWSLSENCSSEYTYDDYYDGNGYDDNQDHVKNCCLPDGTYNLVCTDHSGDGWNGGYLTINGTRFCDDDYELFADEISFAVTIEGIN